MSNPGAQWRAGQLPPLKLPLLYLAFATLCFAMALLGIVLYAQDLTGFYYHPHILALTHLVTLGWISGNILGTLYIVGPMALQVYLPAKRYDAVAFALYAIGVSGMVAHFWRDRPVGMAWSAGCAYFGMVLTGIKICRAISKSKAPGAVRCHVFFAFTNLFVGGGWGFMVAIHKVHGFLPTAPYATVIAHAHLAAIGWASMMVFGMAYRLLPMYLPAVPVKGAIPWAGALFLEAGILGFFFSTLAERSAPRMLSVIFIAAGIVLFFISAIRIVSRRKPAPPPEIPRPDFSMLHAPLGFIALGSCVILGGTLLFLPQNEATLQWTFAYGALGLLGFLSQIVIGLKPKILSVFAWYHAFSRRGAGVPRPVDMPVRVFQVTVFVLWLIGLPLIVVGLVRAAFYPIQAGGILLLAALVIATIHEYTILRIIR